MGVRKGTSQERYSCFWIGDGISDWDRKHKEKGLGEMNHDFVLDMLSLWASGRRSYAQDAGSGLTEAHTNFWQSLIDTT